MPEGERLYRAVVVASSTGGVEALQALLCALPRDFPLPILVVQHMSPDSGSALPELLDQLCTIRVKEADEGELPEGGTAYLAPPNYHLLVEPDGRLGLSTDRRVRFLRPSADVLFESAAEAFGPRLVGIVLTGAGADGSRGLGRIKEKGGLAVVQDPRDAAAPSMPEHALAAVAPDHLVSLAELPELLGTLSQRSSNGRNRR